jgi:hypothetical protein
MGKGVRQKSLVHARGSLLNADAIGYAREPCGAGKSVCGIRTAHERHPVAYVNIAYVWAKPFNDANSLTAHDCRKIRLAGSPIKSLPHKLATPLLHIEKINAGRFDAHQNLSRTWRRRGKFFPLHYLGTAVTVYANSAHEPSLLFEQTLVLSASSSALVIEALSTGNWVLATGYCFSCPALNKFTYSRTAPGTPAGNCRKNAYAL